MRFQVLSSKISYSNPIISSKGRVTLSFDVHLCGLRELKFSDGNRLVARDLSEKWGDGPLTMGDLYGKTSNYYDHDYLNDGGKTPIGTIISVSTDDGWKEHGFIRDVVDEFCCGFAAYWSEYNEGLRISVFVDSEVFGDLLRVRSDLPTEMFFDIDIRDLDDDRDRLGKFWDLGDTPDRKKVDYRGVTDFTVERQMDYFAGDPQRERIQAERTEDKKDLAKLHAMVSELVAIEKGGVDGAVAKLLRLNLIAICVIMIIGILALILR